MENLLNTNQAAKFLGVSVRTVQNYRKAGIITPESFGEDESALYSKASLIEGVKSLLEGGEKLLKFRPKTMKKFFSLVKSYKKPKTHNENDIVQVYPITQRLVPNFKLCKVIYNLDQEQYDRMAIDDKQRKILEKKNFKKYGDLITVYRISNTDDRESSDPLNEFDYAVYSVCVTYFDKGYRCITFAMIYRALTGKTTKDGKGKVPHDLRNAIILSLKKLIGTVIEIEDSSVNSAFNYDDEANKCSFILPAHFLDAIVNGKDASVIYFDRISPLMEIATNRKQLLTYDIALLDVPTVRNTFMNITLKSYVMRRVCEIKLHKQLRNIITFRDVFDKCRIDEASRDTKMNAREVIIKLFEHLQAKDFIKSFKVVKKENAFYSIHLVY